MREVPVDGSLHPSRLDPLARLSPRTFHRSAPPFSVAWDERGMEEEARPRCQLANRAGASTVSLEASASAALAVPTHQLRKGLDVDRLLDVPGEPRVCEPCGGFRERN
jgi:hypothetical protein